MKTSILFIWNNTKGFRGRLCVLFIAICCSTFVGMLYPYTLSIMIDEVYYRQNYKFIGIISLIYLGLFLVSQLIYAIQHFTWSNLMTKFLYTIREKVYNNVLKLKASRLTNIDTGNLISIINRDIDQIMDFVFMNGFYFVANIFRIFTALFFIAYLNYKMAILVILLAPVSVYAILKFSNKIGKEQSIYREKYANNISWITEILKGIRDVFYLSAEEAIKKTYSTKTRSLLPNRLSIAMMEVYSDRINALITLLSTLLVYIAAIYFISHGQLTIGAIIAILDYFTKCKSLILTVNRTYTDLSKNVVSTNRVMELLEEEIEETGHKQPLSIDHGEIFFKDISFSYGENNIIAHLNLKINSRSAIGIVGPSGVGKSTLINLLMRLYEPDGGEIIIDGQNIKEYSIESLRQQVGVVQQSPVIFDGTVRYNLEIAKEGCSNQEIIEACQKAQLWELISGMPDKLDTVLGLNGIELSGGQKQRISIARMFLKNPKILIFDEATSALDAETEQYIHTMFDTLFTDKTVLIIAHRLSSVIKADQIAVLDDGKVIALGNHNSLLNSCLLYRNLFVEQCM